MTSPGCEPDEPRVGVDDPRLARPWIRRAIRAMSRANTEVTGGRLGGTWRAGSALRSGLPICLLTTTGRRSGQPRTVPLLHLVDGERVVVVASQGGLPSHPDWLYNVRAESSVTVTVGRGSRAMTARESSPAERAEYWPRLVAMYPDFADYQRSTSRVIPVVLCDPA